MKKIAKVLTIFLSLTFIVFSITSCGKTTEELEIEAQTAFSSVMEAFKSGDVEQIKSFCMSPDTISDDTEITSTILNSLKGITYDIKSTSADDRNNVTINAEITMIDSSKVMEKYIDNIVSLVSSPEYQSKLGTMSREDYQKIMIEEFEKALTNQDIPTVKKGVNVDMRYDNGTWKLNGSELTDLLITNTIDAINQIRQ